VSVSLNDQNFVGSLSLVYEADISLTSIKLTYGSTNGGTTVTVYGSQFKNTASSTGLQLCSFGETAVSALYLASNRIECLSPPATTPSKVKVRVSKNGGYDWTSEHEYFNYVKVPRVHRIWPLNGRASGNTIVTVYGENLIPFSKTSPGQSRCQFGGVWDISHTAKNDSMILCESPSNSAGYQNVEVTIHDHAQGDTSWKWDFTTDEIKFLVHSDLVITRVEPWIGQHPERHLVTVFGKNFLNSSELNCMFGSSISSATYLHPG
jgi:hypothetical protein